MKKVFCSCYGSTEDDPLAIRLLKDLNSMPEIILNLDTELSQREFFIDHQMTIWSKAISESNYFLLLLSEYSDDRGWNVSKYQSAFFDLLKSYPHLNIIKVAISRSASLSSSLLGVGAFGTVIGLGKNYELGLKEILQAFDLNSENQLIEFSLDELYNQNTIITISKRVNEKIIQKLAKNPTDLKTFNRKLFEELVAELFLGFGFEVELTKLTRDGGRDIIAIKNDEAKLKYLIECKRPDPGNLIGVKPVRELFGVKADEKASKAILATTSYFTKDALYFFERNKWELEPKDFNGLISWINNYKKIKNIA